MPHAPQHYCHLSIDCLHLTRCAVALVPPSCAWCPRGARVRFSLKVFHCLDFGGAGHNAGAGGTPFDDPPPCVIKKITGTLLLCVRNPSRHSAVKNFPKKISQIFLLGVSDVSVRAMQTTVAPAIACLFWLFGRR